MVGYRVIAAVTVGGVLLLSACSGDRLSGADPETKGSGFEIKGTLSVPSYGAGSGTTCTVKDGYEDLRSGATVAVTNAKGDVVSVGSLVDIEPEGSTCRFAFDVANVPEGSATYGIEIGQQGVVKYPRARLDKDLNLKIE
jgi:hypothetical protein